MKKNILANFIGKFWSVLSNFLFIPLYISLLGFESYSIISFTLVIAGLMAVLDGGLTATLSREFARMDNNLDSKISVYKTVESIYLIIILICILVLYLISDFISHEWLKLEKINPERVSLMFKLISFETGFQMLLRFYLGGLLGLEKQVKSNIYQIIWGFFRNGIVILIIFFVPTIEAFFLWQTFSTIIFAFILKFELNKQLTGNYFYDLKPKIEKIVFLKIWRFAGGMLLISFVASLNSQIDKLVISKLLNVESLGYYTLSTSIAMGIFVLVTPISTSLLPRFTSLYSVGKTGEAELLFVRINLIINIVAFSIMIHMILFSEELIWIWTGNIQLASKAFIYLPIISISYTMLSLAIIPYSIAIANGYTKLNNRLGIISLIITLPGYWYATKFYGGVGAAIVFCIVQTLITLIYIYFIKIKFLINIKFSTLYVGQMIIPLFISILIAYCFSLIIFNLFINRIETLFSIGISVIFTIIITIFLLVSKGEIKSIINLNK